MVIISAVFKLTRPLNCLIGGLSILIAAIVAGIDSSWDKVGFAVLSGIFITAGANSINDWFDLDIDRINRPDRVLPQGLISTKTALGAAIILFACGIIISIFINFYAIIITVLSSIVLLLYSAFLKRQVLWGNITVSFMTALAFIYGALAAGNIGGGVVPALLAFQFHLGREIIKDMEDMEGDKKQGAKTLPIVHGEIVTKVVVTIVFALLIGFSFVPYVLQIYNLLYLITVVIGVDFVLLSVSFLLWKNSTERRLNLYSTILKIDMLIGLLAIYVGK